MNSVYRTEFRSAPAVEVEDDVDTQATIFEPSSNNFSITATNETVEEEHLTNIRGNEIGTSVLLKGLISLESLQEMDWSIGEVIREALKRAGSSCWNGYRSQIDMFP